MTAKHVRRLEIIALIGELRITHGTNHHKREFRIIKLVVVIRSTCSVKVNCVCVSGTKTIGNMIYGVQTDRTFGISLNKCQCVVELQRYMLML